MATVEVYERPLCPYCHRAKSLLRSREINFASIDVSWNVMKRVEMMQGTGGRYTVPQIFIGERHIGGSDDLYALDREGKLAALLPRVEQSQLAITDRADASLGSAGTTEKRRFSSNQSPSSCAEPVSRSRILCTLTRLLGW